MSIRSRRPGAGLVLFCCTTGMYAAPTGPAPDKIDFADPPQGMFVDEWLAVEIQGGKVGYAHNEVSRSGGEINSTTLVHMSLTRLGSPVNITVVQGSRERMDGVPLEFSSQMNMSTQTLETRGTIQDGKVRIISKQFGVATKMEYEYPAGALMSWGALRKQHLMGFAADTKYEFEMYDPTLSADSSIPVSVEIHGREQIEIDGKNIDAIRSGQLMMGLTSTTWLDDSGAVLRTTLNVAGLPMIMTRTSKTKALAEFSPPEFFMPTTIKVDQSIDRKQARRIDYRLRLLDSSVKMPAIPNTALQTVTKTTPDSINLTVSRVDHDALRSIPIQAYGKEHSEYLAPNPVVNSDDPAVRKMARLAKGDATRPYEIADRLRKYVTEVITDKNLDVGFASASEVCRNRQGDCTEHAVLLAALGRACGLPTRVVTGIVYVPVFGGDNDIFGFHMWTQILIGDQWVDFDAAQHESDCNPTHIAFGTASLSDAGLGQIVFGLVNVIGNLDLEIEKISPGKPEG